MSARLVNVRAGDLLGDRQLFRLTLEADLLGQVFNSQFLAGVQQLFDTLASSRVVYPVSQPAPLPGQQAAVIDVRVSSGAASVTVAGMIAAINELPVFSNVFNVAAVERLSNVPATATTPAVNTNENSTTAAANRDKQQSDASADRATQGLTGLAESVTHWLKVLAVVALILGALYLLTQAVALRRELAG